jgi:hypothetical protein
MRADAFGGAFAVEGPDVVGEQIDAAALFLEFAFDDQHGRGADDAAVSFLDVGAHDDVDQAGLVFEREEDEALGGARALTRDD